MNHTLKNTNKKFETVYVNALRYWVTEDEHGFRKNKNGKLMNNKTVDERITELIHMMQPLKESVTVYRGQKNIDIIYPRKWFSTTDIKEKAKDFSNKECCMFKIYIQPGVRVLDVHSFLQKHYTGIVRHEDEHEIIVEGSGEFYKDIDKKERGFKEIKGEIVTYYFPKESDVIYNNNYRNTRKNYKKPKNINSSRLMNRISKDEYDFINSINDLRTFIRQNERINNNVLEDVLQKILNVKGY